MDGQRFLDWLEEEYRRVAAEEPELVSSFSRGPTDRAITSAWLDIQAPGRVGQIIVWSSGGCDTQVSDAGSDHVTTQVVVGPHELHLAVRQVVDACRARGQ